MQSFSMYTSTMICAPWLCACDKHGSVTELDFQFNCFILLPRLFSNLVSNESATDMADAARQARQARQGKARQNGGCSRCFRRLFSLFIFLVLVQ